MEISAKELAELIKERDFYKTKYEELLEEKRQEINKRIKQLEEEIFNSRMESLIKFGTNINRRNLC